MLDLVESRLERATADVDAGQAPAELALDDLGDLPLPTPQEADRARKLLARHRSFEQRLHGEVAATARELDTLATRRRAGRAYTR